MAGSSTNRVSQSNTDEVHTAVNNQNLSSDTTSSTTQNIRNHDIVHGDSIGGGLNTFNGLSNSSTGVQVFKLQELSFTSPECASNPRSVQCIIAKATFYQKV